MSDSLKVKERENFYTRFGLNPPGVSDNLNELFYVTNGERECVRKIRMSVGVNERIEEREK